MKPTKSEIEPKFFPALVQAYLFGTISAAVALHVAISILAPGDGGTMLALGSLPILIMFMVALALVGIVVFPAAAILSWPLRALVSRQPVSAFILSVGVGTAIGGLITATIFQIGPDDNFSGPLVGFVYGFVWFLVLRLRVLADHLD